MNRVHFRIELVVDGTFTRLGEDELDSLSAAERAAMVEEINAVVVIDGDPALEIADELTALAQLLCFLGPVAVLDDPYGCFLYRSTQATVHTVMIPLATQVRLFGERTPVITAELDELLSELYHCGSRMIRLVEQVGEPRGVSVTLVDLRAAASELRDRLVARGITVGPAS